ncbi:MAG: hypothetical protein AAF436_05360 [Myxococcota bacterium]
MRERLRRPTLQWLLAANLGLAMACGGSSPAEEIEVPLSDLPCESTNVNGVWESAPLPPLAVDECSWFLFQDNATYVFEHPLGRVPIDLTGSLISFNEDGTASTPPSGNVFLVVAADETTVTIRNGQNQAFFLRLVLE